jgi:spore germination cell wall hydrolase CwlJ-like protein
MTSKEKFWMAVNIYHEARGESNAGRIAVGQVVLNRVDKRKQSIKDVILASQQFSWHNGNKFPPITEYESFISCMESVDELIKTREEFKNFFYGADHYFNPDKVLPSWAKKMTFIMKIGNHSFYRS